MRSIHKFQIEYNNVKIAIEILFFSHSIFYRIYFDSSRPVLILTKGTDINGNKFWTCIPEGRQSETEAMSKIIEQYLLTKDCSDIYSIVREFEETELVRGDPNFIFLNFPGPMDILFTGKPGYKQVAEINSQNGLNNDDNFFSLIEGYKLGFNRLLNDFMDDDKNNNGSNVYVYPAVFCLRHFIELILKDTIRKFKIGSGIITSSQAGFEPTHNIMNLFTIVEALLQVNPPRFTAEIMTEKFFLQLESTKKLVLELSLADIYSDAFRYPFKRTRKVAEQIQFPFEKLYIDLINLRTVGNKIIFMLECIHSEAWGLCSKKTANNLAPDPMIDNLKF